MKAIMVILLLVLAAGTAMFAAADFEMDSAHLDERVETGDTISTYVSADVGSGEDVRFTVMIPELGLRSVNGPDTPSRAEVSKRLFLDLPSDMPSGEYVVRIVVSNDDDKRVFHRFVVVE
ncbi:hypothetical protein HY642_02165 [Candidatus Woesearchaeota archaeon]|nr:hypothetical protein [Candidatus Woesearchaeota archaeon]